MKNIIFILTLIFKTTTTIFCQTPSSVTICSIKYTYDAAGNRTKREYVCETVPANPPPSARKPNPNLKDLASITSVVFPNPSNGVFTIETDKPLTDASVIIYDVQGKLLKKFSFTGNKATFDIRTLAVGQYTIQLVLPDGIQVHQLIKQDH
jgi:hypothetical protein